MAPEKTTIDDAQIIALYRAGHSQNDIVREYQVSVQRTRAVLKEANFDTRSYRALNETMERVIQSLVRKGVYYIDIERIADISFHAVRFYVTTRWKPDLEERSRLPADLPVPDAEEFPMRDKLIAAYKKGISFCLLVNKYELDEDNIFSFYLSITDDTVNCHRKALRKRIQSDLASGLSVSMIARKSCISRAIIKKYGTDS